MSPRRKKKQSVLPLILVGAGSLLLVAVLIIAASGGFGGTAAPTVFPTAVVNNAIPFPEIERINIADSHAAWEAGSAVFVDTRGDPYYSSDHIPGALNLTEGALPGELADLPKDTWIITYCT